MSTPIRILVVEDSADDAYLLVQRLREEGYDPVWKRVETAPDYEASLHSDLDIVFSDFTLPQFTVREGLDLLHQRRLTVPFIIVSGTIGEERVVESLKAGATDYVLKDRLDRLPFVVDRALRESRERTERYQAEERLREAHTQLRYLLSQSPAVIYTLKLRPDQSPEARLVSDNITALLGFSLKEASEPAWWQAHVHPDDLPRLAAQHPAIVREGGGTLEYRICNKQGAYQWVEDKQHVVQDEHGRPREIVGVWMDITDRRRADAERLRLARQMQLLLESTGEGIFGIDLEGRVTFINLAGASMLGRQVHDILGLSMHDLSHHHKPDGAPYPARECPVLRTLRAGERCRVDTEVFWRADDQSFPVEYSSFPIIEDGKITGAVVTFSDITERRKLEEQFRQAQKMESIGQLAGGVAHDFNNLLTVIQGNASLLVEGSAVPPVIREAADQISAAAVRAASLTQQLLTFSRKRVIQPRLLDLNQIVGHMTRMLQRILGEDIRMEVDCSPRPSTVRADAGMMEQILMNLAVNARDAMPHGGRLIIRTCEQTVTAGSLPTAEAKPGTYVCLSVQDTGSGIPPEVLPRIFEPFFTTKSVGKGTGLGLATIYGIVHQHQGWITVDTEVNRGTTFRICLPHVVVAPETASQSPPARILGGTETILLVEDDAAVRELVKAILEGYGYNVREAESGRVALDMWRSHRDAIDLVLTDVIMPDGMTGHDLVNALHAEKPDLPTICSSGYSSDILGKNFVLKDGLNFLQKPYLPAELAKAVRDALDHRGNGPASDHPGAN